MKGLFAPAVVVNNVAVAIKPNSFKYTRGVGTRNVRVTSTGGGGTKNVVTEDIESKKGMCSFVLVTTGKSKELVDQWQDNFDANTIEAVEGDVSLTFLEAVIVDDPERATGTDGEIAVSFTSRPVV